MQKLFAKLKPNHFEWLGVCYVQTGVNIFEIIVDKILFRYYLLWSYFCGTLE